MRVKLAVPEIFNSKACTDGTAKSAGEVMPSCASFSQKIPMYSEVRKGRTVSATACSGIPFKSTFSLMAIAIASATTATARSDVSSAQVYRTNIRARISLYYDQKS